MGLPTGLKQEETNELLWARIEHLTKLLASMYPSSFHVDLAPMVNAEIDSSSLAATDKTKLKDEVKKIVDKVKPK